ncbi:MAG: hypothetical protein R6V47_06310 [Candidatus Delongbacteria bacterium]
MNIEFRRKPDKEEMAATYEFFRKHKNKIIAFLIAIALIIIISSIYRSNYESNRITAADKLFEIRTAYNSSNYEQVINRGNEYIKKYSGYDSTGDILILVAKSYIRQNNTDQAVAILEDNKDLTDNPIFKYSVHNHLASLYMDKWLIEKDPEMAKKSGDHYLKAAESDRELHKERNLYKAAQSFTQAGNITKAKNILTPLYQNLQDLEYNLREEVKYLYENIE